MLNIILTLLLCFLKCAINTNEFCLQDDKLCSSKNVFKSNPRYILYDVNHSEGFNLRRDVYMRIAIFIHLLQRGDQDWHLVLPPWPHLFHWHSEDVLKQNSLPWSSFFEVNSLKRFSPVMEFYEFVKESENSKIDEIYVLQHFEGAFKNKSWNWDDRWQFADCDNKVLCTDGILQTLDDNGWKECPIIMTYLFKSQNGYKLHDGIYYDLHSSYENISSSSLRCVSFQGPASYLENILKENNYRKQIMIGHAEIVVHDGFGDQLYWKCRRSMRFAVSLVKEADAFRHKYLGCNDINDNTIRPAKWEDEKKQRKALGGPYICAHLRRGDFVYSRGNQLPSLKFAAKQLEDILTSLKLKTVFLATDGSSEDVNLLKDNLKDINLIQYIPDRDVKIKIKDGGVAIVDQIICSYARYFIGTHESTFTFRIQEEREIIGFPVNTTFNVFCATPEKCFETSKWTIVY